jgi:antitoxin HigA-1
MVFCSTNEYYKRKAMAMKQTKSTVKSMAAHKASKAVSKKKPVSVGEVLANDYLKTHELTQLELSVSMGVSRKTVNELCMNKRSITADTALMLAKVFSTTPEYWLDLQQKCDLWSALNDTSRRQKIDGAKKLEKRSKKSS